MRKHERNTWAMRLLSGFLVVSVWGFCPLDSAAGLFDDAVSGRPVDTSEDEAAKDPEPAEKSPPEDEAGQVGETPAEGEGDSASGTADSTAGASVSADGTAADGSTGADGATEGASEEEADASASEEEETNDTEDDDDGASFLGRTGLGFDLNGHLRADIWAGKMPDYSRGVIKAGYGEAALKLRVSKSPYGDAFGEIRFKSGYLDDHYLGRPSDAPLTEQDRYEFDTQLDLREAYVNFYAGPFELRMGHQIIVWGRADGINPTNNLTPFDLRVRSPEEDDRRLGNLALRANLNFSPVRIEGIWLPIYKPSLMPEINIADSVRFANPDYPNVDLSKGTLAGKFHLIFSKFEMSLSYLYGYAVQPGIALDSFDLWIDDDDLANRMLNSVTVRRKAFQQQVVGFDFSTTVKDWFGLRGELAFRLPNDYDDDEARIYTPSPDLYYVAGMDREIGNVMLIGQYVGRTVLDQRAVNDRILAQEVDVDLNDLEGLSERMGASLNDNTVAYTANRELQLINRIIHGQKRKIQHGAFMRIDWRTLHDTLSLSLTGMINVSTMEWVVYPKLVYSITDAMTLAVGAEVYMGDDDTLFNYIEEILSAGYTELKISF